MPDTAALRLKAAFRDVVKAAGGQERAALLTGQSQSRVSEAASAFHPDRMPRIDHVAIPEADSGLPAVTRVLADLAGFAVAPRAAAPSADPHVHLARIITETGEVTAATSQALADGAVAPAEARSLRRRDRPEAHLQGTDRMSDAIRAILDAVTDRVFAYRPKDKGEGATCKELLQVRTEGKVKRQRKNAEKADD